MLRSDSIQMVRVCVPLTFIFPLSLARFAAEDKAAGALAAPLTIIQGWLLSRESGRANDRLRSRVQQPRARSRARRDFRALARGGCGLPRAHEGGRERRARPRLWHQPAPDRRPVLSRSDRPHAARAVHPWRLLA